MGIRIRLALIFLVLAAIPMLVLGFLVFFQARTNLEARILEQEKGVVESEAVHVEDELETYYRLVLSLRDYPSLTKLPGSENEARTQAITETQQIFQSFLKADPRIFRIKYLDLDGKEMVRVDGDNGVVQIVEGSQLEDESAWEYFQEAQSSNTDVFISPYDLNIAYGKIQEPYVPVLRVVAKVRNDETKVIEGYVVLNLHANDVIQEGLRSVSTETQYEVLIDSEGNILIHPDSYLLYGFVLPNRANYFVLHPEMKDRVAAFDEAIERDSDDQEFRTWKKVFYDPAHPERYWALISVYTESSLFAPVTVLSNEAIRIGVLSLIAITAITFLLASLITSPLRTLTEASNAIAQNNFSKPLPLNRFSASNEISLLAKSFEKMRGVVEKNRSTLEKRVADRTAELSRNLTLVERQKKGLAESKAKLTQSLKDVKQEKDRSLLLAQDLKKFGLAVDQASDQIVITNPDGIIVYANDATTKITGFSANEIIGKKAGGRELWGGLMPKAFYSKFWTTIFQKKLTFKGEVKNKRKNGEIYEASVTVSPVLDDDNNVLFFVGIERDITKEKEIDRAKTEFVSLASHQLRTPISAINWYAEMLLDGDVGKLKKNQLEYVKEIYHGNQRMVDLVNALLNVSRIELGTLAVDPQPTDITELCRVSASLLQPMINEKEIKLVMQTKKGIPLIHLDPKLIQIVFDNLLSNAVKYTPEKGKIWVKMYLEQKNAIVEIKDNGYGIPQKQQDKIFTKLFRADNVKVRETDGTGLGLYIAKAVVEMAGGKISFVSEEGKGTTFLVSLPIKGMRAQQGNKGLISS
ncbi:MAG: PAS domain S-box protein [Candidatus Nomurabacteria bacterium]|nr:MAG: PAS domain S-box protein [Candidatus Nomurabacteria bacterium]